MPSLLRDAALYGSLAFGLGFLFGAARELLLIPWLGATAGRSVEFVAVTIAIIVLGVWLARSWPRSAAQRLVRGILAVAVLLAFESALAVLILGQPLATYLQGFDITAGSLFPIGLGAMALAPVVARRR